MSRLPKRSRCSIEAQWRSESVVVMLDDQTPAQSPIRDMTNRQIHRSLVADARRESRRTSGNAPSDNGRGQQGHARPGRASDDHCADHREGLSPTLRGHADLGETECSVIAGDGGWHGEEQGDCDTDQRRADYRESDLPNDESGGRLQAERPGTAPITPAPLL